VKIVGMKPAPDLPSASAIRRAGCSSDGCPKANFFLSIRFRVPIVPFESIAVAFAVRLSSSVARQHEG
jgi:hypothetical protein